MGKTKKLQKGANMLNVPDGARVVPPVAVGARPLSERAMLVRFSVGRWYGTGADNELLDEIKEQKGATGHIGTFTKRLMDKQHLAEINRVTNEARAFFKSKTLPYDDGNLRLLAVEHFFDVKKKMTMYDRNFSLAVEKFLSVYAAAVQQEKKRLGGLWRERDYPSMEALRERFRFELHFRPLEDADDLRVTLPKEELEEIRREITENVQRNISSAVTGMIENLRAALEDVSRRIGTPGERLPASMINALRTMVADLPGFNLMSDPAIKQATDALAAEFAKVGSGDEVVRDTAKRESTKVAVDKALGALKALIPPKKGESK